MAKQEIDHIIQLFFSVFNNKDQTTPDWQTLYCICIPQTIIIKKSGNEETVYGLDDFIAPRKIILTNGTLTGFEEHETSESTLINGNLAQRHTRYSKSGNLNGTFFSADGAKHFQLIQTTAGWKISAVLWEDDV
jgi:hypothetical protein